MNIGIVGCAGRMGRMLIEEVVATEGAHLAGGTEAPGSPLIGKNIGELTVSDDAGVLFAASDAIIDFTVPAATRAHAAFAAKTGTAMVIGTTGLTAEDQAILAKTAEKAAIVQAANFSLGVNILLGLVEQTARILDPSYDIEIVEMHHRHKVDAPSGTSLALGRAAAAGRAVDLEDVWDKVRDGHTGERKEGAIGFATLRGGDVAGDHMAVFAGEGERIELGHRANNRAIFARGAVRAALWTRGRAPGLYSMADVLGFNS